MLAFFEEPQNYTRITLYLRKLLPTFCFQTTDEIYTFLEGISPEIKIESVKATVGHLHKAGFLLSRPCPRRRPYENTNSLRLEYIRSPGWT